MAVGYEHWPVMPERLQEVDERLTCMLGALPLYNDVAFPRREQQVTYLASQDLTVKETASFVYLSPQTVDTYRGRAFGKTGVSAIEHLVYVCLDSGVIPFEADDSEVRLTSMQALTLKAMCFGGTREEMGGLIGRASDTIKYHLARLGETLGASTREGMIGRAYEVGLFIPRIQYQPKKQPTRSVKAA